MIGDDSGLLLQLN